MDRAVQDSVEVQAADMPVKAEDYVNDVSNNSLLLFFLL